MDAAQNRSRRGRNGGKYMSTSVVMKPRAGSKAILIEEQPDGSRTAACWCLALGRIVLVRVRASQAGEILSENRRNIDTILPDTPPPMREIFITGLTPAEFVLRMRGKLRRKEDYEKLGYGGRL